MADHENLNPLDRDSAIREAMRQLSGVERPADVPVACLQLLLTGAAMLVRATEGEKTDGIDLNLIHREED